METKKDYAKMALEARRKVLTMIHKAGTSHIASNFSVIDIAIVLYDRISKDDEVVWSKGWAAATIYYFLSKLGKIPPEALEEFPRAPYLGLAETTGSGVLCNGGAVGHGTPIATGIALAKKRAGEPGTVYCILSDGELNEGVVWESAMFAAHHKLDNLVFIVDCNGIQAMGHTKDIINLNPVKAFQGFGWSAGRFNGHNYDLLECEINAAGKNITENNNPNYYSQGSPRALICDTIKGKGVDFMQGLLLYHYKNVDAETYEKAMAQLV